MPNRSEGKKFPGRGEAPFPGVVDLKVRYGRLMVVLSPDAVMVNVPAAVLPVKP
jgi:hypothetical protein